MIRLRSRPAATPATLPPPAPRLAPPPYVPTPPLDEDHGHVWLYVRNGTVHVFLLETRALHQAHVDFWAAREWDGDESADLRRDGDHFHVHHARGATAFATIRRTKIR